jgi:hypothetical protein
LTRVGGGTIAVIDAAPRDEASAAMIRKAFAAARVDEWAEFMADCRKFEQEIAREIGKQKFTFGELEEEEQSLERLRRWYRDMKKRDVLELPEADAADRGLRGCAEILDGYAEQVYQVVQALLRRWRPRSALREPLMTPGVGRKSSKLRMRGRRCQWQHHCALGAFRNEEGPATAHLDGLLAPAVLVGLALDVSPGWWCGDRLACCAAAHYAFREGGQIFRPAATAK